jgi:hypothetical protein
VALERPDWSGRTVVCIASGPSLTEEDCEAVRLAGHPTIVTNTTFRRCLWADAVVGFDSRWWNAVDDECKRAGFATYAEEVKATFRGQRFTCSQLKTLGASSLYQVPWFRLFANSGASAISLAISGGASRVVLLGYDCQRTGGKSHWHGDHGKTMQGRALSNCKSLPEWPAIFARVAKFANGKGVDIVNCSRATALQCFTRMDLASELEENLERCG